MSGDTTKLRIQIETAVHTAAASGETYNNILADVSTVLGILIAASSPDHSARLLRVKASMAVVEAVLSRGYN